MLIYIIDGFEPNFGCFVCVKLDEFFIFRTAFQTRRGAYKLYKPTCENASRRNLFVERVCGTLLSTRYCKIIVINQF